MPGLCAVVQPPGPPLEPLVDAMLRRMTHETWFRTKRHIDDANGLGVGVVTLDTMPDALFATADRSSLLLLDGELYDADKERQRLQKAGIAFSGASHAEILLKGWQHEGAAFLAGLHGLFTALVWHAGQHTLTVITDRFGLRPCYIAKTSSGIAVASEIKALAQLSGVDRSWSDDGFGAFFAFGYFFNDHTLFRGVRAVPPATCAVYHAREGLLEQQRYALSRATATALEPALVAAVHRRAAPGERLGLSLSGGLDARTLLGLMPSSLNLTSVSIGIEGSIDHRGASKLAELAGVRHHSYLLDQSFLGSFERHLRSMITLTDGHYLDQGIVMPTLPRYRDLGIDYLMRGHGGELIHMRKAYAFSLDDAALRANESELESWLYAHCSGYMLEGVPRELFTIDVEAMARTSLRAALQHTTAVRAPVDRVWDLFLNERLHRETALSMHMFNCFSTVRMPYIDNGVVDALATMPASAKLGDEQQTKILRHLRPDFLGVVNSNTGAKMGASRMASEIARFRMRVSAKLGLPGYQPYERLGLWLRQELRPMVERVLLSESLLSRGLFRPDVVTRVVNQHMDRQANHTFLLMSLMIFELGQQMLADPDTFAEVTRNPPS